MQEFTVENWEQFVGRVGSFDPGTPMNEIYEFRGQADFDWTLEPALLRLAKAIAPKITAAQLQWIETQNLREFKRTAHRHLDFSQVVSCTNSIHWLAIMQHFGAPTRLLDWSTSPYAALYFAVIDCPRKDGAVYGLNVRRYRDLQAQLDPELSKALESDESITTTFSNHEAPESLIFLGRNVGCDREVAQQGGFSLCRRCTGHHGDIISQVFGADSEKDNNFFRIKIPASMKVDCLRRLRQANVTAGALFPGLDGLGRSIRESVQIILAQYQ